MKPDFFQNINGPEKARVAELFYENQNNVFKQTDRMFSILLPVQWLAGVVAACFFTPLTWNGEQSSIHPHVWAAVLIGGAITSLPFFLTVFHPGEKITRYVVAVSQMLMSGLLIHITDGRAETHFHVFGSLAFLACYRDWRVLIPATIITAFDHFFRGWLYPFSIYGTVNGSEWRWLEHAGWVVFIDIFLIFSCLRSVRVTREISIKTAATNSSEERYRTIIEQMTESIFLLEVTDLKVVECNQAFADLLGCQSIEEAKTLYAQDFDAFKPQDIRLMTSYLDRDKTKSMSAERKYLRRDGTWIYVEITGRFITYNNTAAYCVNARDITGRKQTQIELKKLALVAEKTQNAVIITDPEGKITWVNEGFTRLTEYRLDEVIGHRPGKLLQGQKTNRETIAAIHEAISRQQPYNGEIYNYRKNKTGYWCSLSIMPITSDKGDLKGFISIEMDITERKAMEEKLQLSYEDLEVKICERTAELVTANKTMQIEVAERKHAEENLQNSRDYLDQIINAVADPIFVKNRRHQLIMVNEAMIQFLGRSREEVLGKSSHELFCPNEADVFWKMDELVFTSGEENINEEIFTDPQGSKHTIITRKKLHTDEKGQQFLVGVSRDITERIKSEEITRQSEEKYRNILETINEGYFEIDLKGNLTYFNDALCLIIGYDQNQTLGMKYQQYVDRKYGKKLIINLKNILKTGQSVNNLDWEIIRQDKTKRFVESSMSLMRNAENEPIGFRGVVHDVTERKLAEEALQNSRDYLDQIINAVADPIFVKNRQHQLTLVNDVICQFTGQSREEILGKTTYNLFSPHGADLYSETDELVFTSGKENVSEEEFTDLRGNKHIIVTRKRVHIDKDGEQFIVGVSRDITIDRKNEKRLKDGAAMQRQLAERQSAILDALPAHICLLDQAGNILEVNNEWKQFSTANDYSGNNFGIGSNYIETCENSTGECTEGAKQAAEICRAVLAGETAHFEMEYPCHSPNEKRWFKLTVNALHKDKFAGAVVMHVNITERKLAEEALQNSRDYLDQIMNSVSSPIFVKNRNHELTLVNDAMCQLMKRSREDSIGKRDHDVYPANEADVYQAKDELVFTSKKENVNEESLTDSDGNLRIIVTKKRLHIDKEGAEYIVGVINDITELKLAEHNLSEAKLFLSTVIDNIPNLISVKDLEGRYVLANRALAELYDTNIENVIGKTDADFIDDPAVVERYRLAEQTVIDTLEEIVVTDEKITDADGNMHWFQMVKRPLIGTEGVENILGIATDLTEAKIIESQLRQAQKMESIGQLAAGIAHEINTPTQYVSDNTRFISDAFDDFKLIFGKYGELLRRAESGEINPLLLSEIKKEIESSDFEYLIEEVPKAIRQSLEGVSRIAKIVQSMKDFAHPGTGAKHSADLNRAIESTVTVARNEWKYVAEIETRFDENLPLVPCYLGEFNQVVLNMVINAAHAISDVVGDGSNSRGKITITTTKVNNDWAEIRIGDTGNGIPQEIQEKIFDPFFTTKVVGKGTGQGLAISHTVVVDKHQGQLNFETEIGRGTTFIIRLPLDNSQNSKPDAK